MKYSHTMPEVKLVYEFKDKNPKPPPVMHPNEIANVFQSLNIQKLQAEIRYLNTQAEALSFQAYNNKWGVHLGYMAELRSLLIAHRINPDASGLPGGEAKALPLIENPAVVLGIISKLITKLKEEAVGIPTVKPNEPKQEDDRTA